jgi:hypothetical protein
MGGGGQLQLIEEGVEFWRGAQPLGSLHGAGGGRRGGHGTSVCQEEAVFDRRGRRRKKRSGWAAWAERPNRPVGRLSRLGRKLEKNSFQDKNWIFKYTKPLKTYTRRFRRSFYVGFFLNSSRLLKDFRKI